MARGGKAQGAVAAVFALAVVGFAIGAGDERVALARTLGVSTLAALVALALGIGYGIAVGRFRLPARRLLILLGFVPLVVPPYLAAIAWVDVFGPAGWVPRSLGLEIPQGPSLIASGLVYTTGSAGVLLGCCFFPLVLAAVLANLSRLPASALEAARLARGRRGEARVLVASLLPAALGAALVVFALCAVEFAVPQLLRIRVLSESAYLAMAADHDPTLAAGRSLPLVALVALAVGAAGWRWRLPPARPTQPVPLRPAPPKTAAPLLTLCGIALIPGVALPLVSLGLRLLVDPTGNTSGGLSRARAILANALQSAGGDAGRSLEVGALTAGVAVALAVVIAWPLRRARAAPAAAVTWGALALTALPAPLVGVGVVQALNREGLLSLYDSLGAVVLVCLLRFGPLAILIVWLGLRRIDPAQEEAALLARREPLTGVVLPQALPSLLAAVGIVYVLAVTEFGASSLVAPPGQSVLSVFLVNEAHYGQGSELSGLCVLLLGIALIPPALVGALVQGMRAWRS